MGAVVESESAASWRINENRPLTELLGSESLGRLGALMAVDGEGVLRGVVTVEQVRRALQSAFGPATSSVAARAARGVRSPRRHGPGRGRLRA